MRASQPDIADLKQHVGNAGEHSVRRRFCRQQRLLKPSEFKQVFGNACRVGSQYLTLLAISNHLGHPRLGMAISRKNVRRAVKRNLIKRQLRESFRHHQDIIGDFDVVVLAKAGCGELPRQELRRQIDSCWQKIAKKCVVS